MTSRSGVAGLLSGPQTGTVFDIVHRFWRLILAVTLVVSLCVAFTATRPRTAFRSTAWVEVEAIGDDNERRTAPASSTLPDFRSDAVHERVESLVGVAPGYVEWRASQEEDAESLHLDVVADDPVLALQYVETWMQVAESRLANDDAAPTSGVLATIDDQLAVLLLSKEELDVELNELEESYRVSRDAVVGIERDIRRLELDGESGALQNSINEYIDVRSRLERAGPADELALVVLKEPKQAAWGRSSLGLAQDLVLGSFLGLLLGLGAALLAAVVRPRLYSRADLESLGVEVIGPIPSELLAASNGIECSDRSFSSQVLVGSCGDDAELSARVAAQLATGGAYELKSRDLGVRSVGSLRTPETVDGTGLALGTVVAVRSGESTPDDLGRVLRSIRHAGGRLVCVVIVGRNRPPWFGLRRRGRHAG